MKSLAKPRKITIRGSNGQTYMFLGKPKDDLRKDARLMDLNAIINKLLKGNSESRRRQLRRSHFCSFSRRVSSLPCCFRRHQELRCRHIERGMRLHSMGSKHDTHSPRSEQILRSEARQELGRMPLFWYPFFPLTLSPSVRRNGRRLQED